jgi:UDP-N-acetylglucosamine 2-epimerase (non-hydrolysing)
VKIASIIGARPQFIKYAALSEVIRKDYDEIIIHSGQHYDFNMSGVFFKELDIPNPDYNLNIGSGTHGYQIGNMLIAIEEVLSKVKPRLTLVYGDTNTTLAGAIAASKLHIKLGHVEAGPRFRERDNPEEINRILTSHCSDLLFCPSRESVRNLYGENIKKGVHLTGDVMIDLLLRWKEVAEESKVLQVLDLTSKQFIVATIHRASNTDNKENLNNIVDALCRIDLKIVLPLHPRTEFALKSYGLYKRLEKNSRIHLIKPLGYLDFLKLMNNAQKILTDSGGIQRDAYISKVPCITLLETTGWNQTVKDGWNVLVGANTERIVKMARDFGPGGEQEEDFGNGQACINIRNVIASAL